MNLLLKEYRAIFAATVFALLSIGGSGAFFWNASQERDAAALELQKTTKEFGRLISANPAPIDDSVKQLEGQLKAAENSEIALFEEVTKMTIPLDQIQPQEFQTSVIEKTQSFIARAGKKHVPIPPPVVLQGSESKEPVPFSMGFDYFVKNRASDQKAPVFNRELVAADRLLNTWLDSKPRSLLSFKIYRPHETPENQKDTRQTKTDQNASKSAQSGTEGHVLDALWFFLKFTTSPDSLREFINSLARDSQTLFIVRKLKVTTLSKEGVNMVAPSKTFVAAPIESDALGQPKAPAEAQYILGDEYIEVEMRVDLVQVAKPVLAGTPKSTKTDTGGPRAVITGAEGQAIRYQIVGSNHPTSFGASGLAPGLSLDCRTGLVSGTLIAEGVHAGSLFATNKSGTGSMPLEITVKRKGSK